MTPSRPKTRVSAAPAKFRTSRPTPPGKPSEGKELPSPDVIDLDRYAPAFLTWIANKLSRGASQHYLALFDVGIEIWRCLVLLAVHGSVTAQQVSRVIGMDKGAVSRCFKVMQERGLIRTELDPADGRARIAVLTPEGRALHDRVREVALERERAFLSVLNPDEVDTLLSLLRRLHENLPTVEIATQNYVKRRFPEAAARGRKRRNEDEEE
ncbi:MULTISPECIES: MarR family winged helix-turn-helix transcriptional regulator [Ramlibacter]|uniref:MarR family transcriptional regulator n=1 Tax=Ramlibacter pinisoli TaxID=2682844 RepID=A0A6N8ILY5_9BURK|nr:MULTISPECIES: MarR family winged helix-turn-helix transcriptional regulator [Ramlibacter]MBA2960502.1 winged helix-turn-helix transcriptional regulator [Ramlibacter sp. CGMCC 1.13660]MVQ27834.1 MarR family transcriptional regulator [Ramlibacter pinisoli]